MSHTWSWRRVALVCAVLMAAAAALAWMSSPDADAQEPPLTATFVIENIPVTPSNGHFTFVDAGLDDGFVGIACSGFAPRSGNSIPGQVVTQLGSTATFLRVLRNDGAAITGSVAVNCVIEVELTPVGMEAAEQLRDAAAAG
jgi:hypothetical protein